VSTRVRIWDENMSDSGKECTPLPPTELDKMMFCNELRRPSGVAHGLAYLD